MSAETLFADRYRLERRLGVGGMATVQLALRHPARALRRRQAAGRAPRRGPQLRLALPARGARPSRASSTRTSCRSTTSAPTSAPAASTSSWSTSTGRAARRSCASTAGWRPARRSTSSPRPAAGSPTRTATASCTATSSRGTSCAAATAGRSSSPTSGSPRRRSSPTSRRSAPCSARRRTSRPSRRAAEPAGPAVRHLRARRRRLPAAGRAAALRRRLAHRPGAPAGVGPPARAARARPGHPARAVARRRARAGPRPGRPLPRRAREMEHALADGLRGVPPAGRRGRAAARAPEDGRGCSSGPRPRGRWPARPGRAAARMEPIQERAAAAARAPGASAAAARRPGAGRSRRSGARRAAAVRPAPRARRRVAGGVAAYARRERRDRARRAAPRAGPGRRGAGRPGAQGPDRGQRPLSRGTRSHGAAPARTAAVASASRPASTAARSARHEHAQEGEVVEGEDARRRALADAEQVVQVGARVAGRARRAGAAVADRLVGLAVAPLGEVDAPAARRVRDQGHAVAADARRHRAVEGVHAELDAAEEVVDVADPEQVARALLRAAPASSSRPPRTSAPCPGRASRRWPGRTSRGSPPPGPTSAAGPPPPRPGRSRRPPATAGPCSACQAQAAVQPAVGALRRARRVVARRVERRALVEHQRDVRAERGLDLHRGLGTHEAGRAVDVGAEADALLLDAEDRPGAVAGGAALDLVGHGAVAHGEDLEAARVGDHRPRPSA